MSKGRLVIDVGEERRNRLKSLLYAKGKLMKDWLIEQIDKFIKESEVKK